MRRSWYRVLSHPGPDTQPALSQANADALGVGVGDSVTAQADGATRTSKGILDVSGRHRHGYCSQRPSASRR